jgi:hypothetical protein
LAVDGGATETVVEIKMLDSVELKDGAASHRGVKYEVASGDTIPNEGEKKFTARTEEGVQRTTVAQVADVSKALLSVNRMVDVGSKVGVQETGKLH